MTAPTIDVDRSIRPPAGRRSFPWLPLLILGLALLLFVAVVAEIGLRVAELRATNLAGLRCVGTSTVLSGQKGLYILDEAAGYVMRPDTCVRLKSTEYDGILRTNHLGMVGPDVGAKVSGEFRIVVLGDSYTVGGQVDYDQTFPALLEQRLHAAGLTGVRVIDAAVGGYTTYNEAGILREHLAALQPDLVVVAAFLGNDVSENVLATAAGYRAAPEHPKGVTWGLRAAQMVDDSGTWFPRNGLPSSGTAVPAPWDPATGLPTPVGNQPTSESPTSPLATVRSQGVRATLRGIWDGARSTSLLLGTLFGVPIDPSVTTAPGSLPLSVDLKRLNLTSFEWTILRDVPHTYWLDVAWPLFGHYLADIRTTAFPAPVILLSIPEMSQVDDQMHARTMQEFRFQPDEVDWERPQRELAAQAQQATLPELDLLPVFRARDDRAGLYLRLDTHFTVLGHQVTADTLAEFLRTRGYIK